MNLDYLTTKDNTMKGLFFIIKGHYRKDYRDKDNHTLGYDPFNPYTSEWYMLVDNRTFTCISCSGDLQKVLKSVYRVIKRHKGIANRYFKQVSMTSSKASPSTQDLYRKVYKEFGDYFEDEVREMENLAYEELKQERPVFKSRKLMENKTSITCEMETPKKENTEKVFTPITLVKPKKVMAIKKLSMV